MKVGLGGDEIKSEMRRRDETRSTFQERGGEMNSHTRLITAKLGSASSTMLKNKISAKAYRYRTSTCSYHYCRR